MSSPSLDSKLSHVVGGKTAQAFAKAFDYVTVRDLLQHYPRRYSQRGELTRLANLPVGDHVTVVAKVLEVRERRMQAKRGSILEATITDGVGQLSLTWFNQSWRASELRAGMRGVFAGKVGMYRGDLQLSHPDYELFPDEAETPADEAMTEATAKYWSELPIPIYPATAKLPSWTIQKTVGIALDALGPVDEPIPQYILEAGASDSHSLLPLRVAYEKIHRPETKDDWQSATESLRFREAFHLQLALLDAKRRSSEIPAVTRPVYDDGLVTALDTTLPFTLTDDQREVGATISRELAGAVPMHRLLQGEVGSGKTIVALRAMLQVADSGGQAAFLAPTEVLAMQHFRSVVDALGPELVGRVNPVLLTGQMRTAERKRALLSIASGNAHIAIGTHALMSETTNFYDLGFIVVDEQHRFGVEQREALRKKAAIPPHVLVMTATPIPRTVALTAFGDLEVSTIRQLPEGRPPLETHVVPLVEHPSWGDRAWHRAAEEVGKGRQVYVVCPAISPSEREENTDDPTEDATRTSSTPETRTGGPPETRTQVTLANVEETLVELRGHPALRDLRIEPLTGSMGADDKNAVMTAFAAGRVDVLVATTVIEVGVNVPNASLMIVRDADRFGVSQLHQLRGRVGRGRHPGLCLLMTNVEAETTARARIEAVEQSNDGFHLAEVDLDLRKEGDVLGQAQSGGRSTLKLLRVVRDVHLIERTRELADELIRVDPDLLSAPFLAQGLQRERESRRLENLSKS